MLSSESQIRVRKVHPRFRLCLFFTTRFVRYKTQYCSSWATHSSVSSSQELPLFFLCSVPLVKSALFCTTKFEPESTSISFGYWVLHRTWWRSRFFIFSWRQFVLRQCLGFEKFKGEFRFAVIVFWYCSLFWRFPIEAGAATNLENLGRREPGSQNENTGRTRVGQDLQSQSHLWHRESSKARPFLCLVMFLCSRKFNEFKAKHEIYYPFPSYPEFVSFPQPQ